MRSFEDERLCQKAQVHYYDLLCQEEAAVPAAVRRHVATCPVCQEQMRRLREALFEAQRPASAAGAWQDETVEALAQQFQLLDERVTCSEAKPLLPELALESPQIRIPTPVTVHVDHCARCAEDLAAIRELHLTADQLKRLGRLLNGERGAPRRRVEGVPPSKRGPQGRAATAPGSLSCEHVDIVCRDLAMADLFDCVVPSETALPGGTTARQRQKAVSRHVRSCPACLRRMQTLQRTLGAIVARADSEVVTVYHAEDDAEEAGGEYPYPVSVQVLHGESEAAWGARAARTALATGLRKLERSAKPLAALAAVVLVGVGLTSFLRTTTPTASGTNLGDVDRMLARMNNVHIVVTGDWESKPIQEYWIARKSRILLSVTGENYVLYDFAQDLRRTLDLQTDERTLERLRPDDVGAKRARQFMEGYLRRVVTEVTPDTKLYRADREIDSGAGQAFDVYELPLSPQARKSPPPTRWLVSIDRVTGLPHEMVSSRQMPGKDGRHLRTTTAFFYLTEQEMDESLQALFPAQ
jgi:ketosteroid isomerase-like protein